MVRARLLEALRARWTRRVTIVCAPAGFGKTTLLGQAMAVNDDAPMGRDCWYGCTPADAALSSLAHGLCSAVGATTPVRLQRAEDVAAAVGEAVWHESPVEVAIIVDDVHEVPPGSGAAELLDVLVRLLPANGHLVFSGRGEPPVPLARLEAQGDVGRLGEGDLMFTTDELAAFAERRRVPPEQVERCGGWPALAELAATAPQHVAADYIAQEVLSGFTPERRRALALLAHLSPVDAEVARTLLPTGVELAELVTGLPLATTEPDGTVSLHAMWRSVLSTDVRPADVAAAQRAAGAVLRARGQAAEAVPLFMAAEAWQDVGESVVHALSSIHAPVPLDVLASWFEGLPPDVRSGPPGTLLAGVLSAEVDPERAWEQVASAASAFRAAGDEPAELACVAHLAQLAWWSERSDRLAGVAARVFELEAAGCDAAAPLAHLARALGADIVNDSRQVLVQLDRIPPGSLNDPWLAVVGLLRSVSLMNLGRADEAIAAAADAVGRANALQAPLIEGARLQALPYSGGMDEVAAALPSLVERIRSAGFRDYSAIASAQCATLLARGGDEQTAAMHLALATDLAVSPDSPLVDANLALAAAAVALASGDDAGAAEELTALVGRHPVGAGHAAAPIQRSLAVVYVLVPSTRAAWEACALGPAFLVARQLARSIVRVREAVGPGPVDLPRLPPPAVVRAHVPLAWAASLGVARAAARHQDGWDLLSDLWPEGQGAVKQLADDRGSSPAMADAARLVLATLPAPPTGRFDLRTLGPVELRCDGALVEAPEWRRERVRELLTYLVVNGTVSRDDVAMELWPDLDRDSRSRNLRVTLTYLLRVLEPQRAARDPSFFVRQHGGSFTLHSDGYLDCDLWAFDRLAAEADDANNRGDPSAAMALALEAVNLWRAEPTELASEPWAVSLVEERRLRLAGLATRAGELLLATGQHERAIDLARRALDIDPWLERGHRLVVLAHRAAGDELSARRALAQYRDALDELGLTPGDATETVARLLHTTAADPSLTPR